jgi:hypothetical protein
MDPARYHHQHHLAPLLPSRLRTVFYFLNLCMICGKYNVYNPHILTTYCSSRRLDHYVTTNYLSEKVGHKPACAIVKI